MILLKFGAKIAGLKPEILLGLMIVNSVFEKYKVDLIITECTGGNHMENSLHYKGLAADIRSKHIQSRKDKNDILNDCRELLGANFDFIIEALDTANEHFHVEMDLK